MVSVTRVYVTKRATVLPVTLKSYNNTLRGHLYIIVVARSNKNVLVLKAHILNVVNNEIGGMQAFLKGNWKILPS